MDLTDDEAHALIAVGVRLASDKTWWRVDDDPDEDAIERSVIRCASTAKGSWLVTVAEAVGIVALPTLQLIVRPKVPVTHFRYLLDRSPTMPRLGEQATEAEAATELWEVVAAAYMNALEQLMRRGLLSDYSEVTDDLPHLRGRLRLVETGSAYYQGRIQLSCEYDEFGPDSPLNRVLREAAIAIASAPVLGSPLRRRARRSLARFDRVGDLRHDDLSQVADRRSHHYGDALTLAHHVLRATGRTIARGHEHAWTFLLRTPDLVEDAVRSILREGLADLLPVSKTSLNLTGTKLRLHPDLVFGDVAIGDVKYSLFGADWRRSHMYQAVTFATGYRVPLAGVFGFSLFGLHPPEVRVGDVSLRAFVWDVRDGVLPCDAASGVIEQVRAWVAAIGAAA